ncbi:hypothetical protein BHE74_00007427 [Ensete ventricosum]|nr:hypothetical protein BHE74_00007427 [Ensete ventricosum]
MSRVSIGFSCAILEIQNTSHSRRISPWEVVRAQFCKKELNGHKLCLMSHVDSSFDRFFVHHLENSKYLPFPSYEPMGSRTSTVLQKNATVINFARSHAQSRVSIGFSCTVSEIQNTIHSLRISPWEVVRARFLQKTSTVINFA